MQDSPLVSEYVKRAKRAIRRIREQRTRKSLIKNCIGKGCQSVTLEEHHEPAPEPIKPTSEQRPTSVFNDYPYEVAILLNNNKNESHTHKNDTHIENKIDRSNYTLTRERFHEPERFAIGSDIKDNDTITKNTTSPKRSMKYDFETEIIKKFEFTEDINKTHDNNVRNDSKVMDRNIFDKDNTVWHQNAPIPDVNVYKVVPKEPQKSKPVTERGLIKVISMLTKTFKKIMKQHNEIKDIHGRISDVNDEFVKNAAVITNKFQDFDLKYLYLIKFHEKLKLFDAKLATKQDYFKNKEREMARNFKEFENQQKKFLQQQRQFYNIQKLMLAQNEKINLKQNLIAKTQSEISHRQNNFARILKKAKQLYVESRNPIITKLSSSIVKANHLPMKTEPMSPVTSTSTPPPESVKINLFSIPVSNKIENQDDLILKEKDEQTIDDLVYKYYFNNTFIDNLMKNNVLTSVMGNSESTGHPRNVKNKRNELETTILLPVFESNDSQAFVTKERERRWINHHSRHKNRRRDRGKTTIATIVNATDTKLIRKKVLKHVLVLETTKAPMESKEAKDTKMFNDPFSTMATNFCNEIHQNLNPQMLRWCVEKALRRLQFLDMKTLPASMASPTTPAPKPVNVPSNTKLNRLFTIYPKKVTSTPKLTPLTKVNSTSAVSTVAVTKTTAPPITQSSTTDGTTMISSTTDDTSITEADIAAFFPDNEELESNLKQFGEHQLLILY
ncbi:hypothetical protein B5X24_HaOG214834 [Helicoverpa armigera]|nr:hypothetical protein B5X24_HaOG214834 [Helicoverpa armigera]